MTKGWLGLTPPLALGAFFAGMVLASPYAIAAWQRWQTVNEQVQAAATQREQAQAWQADTDQRRAQMASAGAGEDPHHLAAAMAAQGLRVSEWTQDRPVPVALAAQVSVTTLPVRVAWQGTWAQWQSWLSQWPTQSPGSTLQSLSLTAQSNGHLLGHATLHLPQMVDVPSTPAKARPMSDEPSTLFDAQAWLQAQQLDASPDAAQAVRGMGLHRVKEPLEFFDRSQLQYVGTIGWGDAMQALVRVNDAQHLQPLYRVSVGAYVGQDAGRVRHIEETTLHIDTWERDASGHWRQQEVQIPRWTGGGSR